MNLQALEGVTRSSQPLLCLLFVGIAVSQLGACAGVMPEPHPKAEPYLSLDLEDSVQVRRGEVYLRDGTARRVLVWSDDENDGPVVLAVHGMNVSAWQFSGLARRLVSDFNLTIIAYDQRGFGPDSEHVTAWVGGSVLVDDLGDVWASVTRAYADRPVYLLGNSMGAAVIASAVGEGLVDPARIVWTSPALCQRYDVVWYLRWLLPATQIVSGIKLPVSKNVKDNTIDPSLIEELQQNHELKEFVTPVQISGMLELFEGAVSDLPNILADTLIVHGTNDGLIDARLVEKYGTNMGKPPLHCWREGAKHFAAYSFVNSDKGVEIPTGGDDAEIVQIKKHIEAADEVVVRIGRHLTGKAKSQSSCGPLAEERLREATKAKPLCRLEANSHD